ncbi:MAG: RNA polymerase subunit sigma-70, partial [Clostridia bacterium]|nr:RNA polymerase subunit sigma-70 [Clostridia bacterium]
MLGMLQYFLENFLFLMLYISSGSSFPKPLSEEEEKYYINEMAKGDKKARDILIERNLRLVVHIMKKYYTGAEEQEDLISIGTIGLIKGINSYDESKKTRLSTY